MNNNQTGTNRDRALQQELEGLKGQFEQLRERKVRTEQDVANLTAQLESLKAQAKDQYGTDDVTELQALLEEKRQQNEKVVAEYREHVRQIQADLAAVENRVEER